MSELPRGWARTDVGSTLQIQYGRGLPERARIGGGSVPVYASSGRVGFHSSSLVDGPVVIIGRKGSVGSTYLELGPCWPIDTVYYAQVPDGLSPHYLAHQLHSMRLARLDSSTAVPSLRREDLQAQPLAIAPLAEQLRIVAAIDEQFSLIDDALIELQRIQTRIGAWRTSVLGHAYADAADRFGKVTLRDRIGPLALFCDGDWVETKDQDPEGRFRLTQLADVGDGVWRNRSVRFMNEEQFFRLNCTRLEPNDILIARMPDPLGRACLFPGDTMPCATAVDVAIIRIGIEGPDARWLMWLINSPQVRSQVAGLQAGTTRKRISRSNLATVQVPAAPKDFQLAQAAEIEAAAAAAQHLAQGCLKFFDRAEALKSSLLRAAFSGSLVWQDPGDEPASALLDRMASENLPYDGRKPTRHHVSQSPTGRITA